MLKAFVLLMIPVALGTIHCPPCPPNPPCPKCPEIIPPGPPGPVIQIGGGTGGPPPTIKFEVETPPASGTMVAQTDGGKAAGRLRDDFIGQRILLFECKRHDNGNWVTANRVTATDAAGTVLQLTMERTSQDTLWWTLENLATTPPSTAVLIPSSGAPAGTVPTEFLLLSAATLTETGLNMVCDQVRFQVQVRSR